MIKIKISIIAGMVFLLLSGALSSAGQGVNFDSKGRQLLRFDVLGNAVDAHDGEIACFNGTYYLYGTSYDCGYEWGNKGAPFCGFKVYASKDLYNWEDKGFLFDATTAIWQSRCNGATYGCYRPHVIYNAKTRRYVLWINVYDNRVGYRVFTSATPTGPFTEAAEPRLAVNSHMPVAGLNNGDHDTFVDEDGKAYLAYTDWRAKGAIVIERLSDDFLTGTGECVQSVTPGNTEAPCLFKRDGIYYLIYSDPNCGYCSGTGTSYRTAPAPLGPWSDPVKISDNSCGGQPSFVSAIKINSEAVYLYGSDLWNNAAKNEALANYFWAPLSFTPSGGIAPLDCMERQQFIKTKKPVQAKAAISTGADGFSSSDDITGEQQYAQSFMVKRSGILDKITVTLFKNNYPDADLVTEIYKADSGNLPQGTAVYTKSIPSAVIGWAPKNITVSPGIAVKEKQAYVIVLRTSATKGSFGFACNNQDIYAGGKVAVRKNNEEEFQVIPGLCLKFEVFIRPEKSGVAP
ncbi:hypothetical protein A8C56_02610 [Niabella ginsenosidivorans]|uniref:Beta-xylosidase n=1 Tax=Niabella ginsenosidivorans TaxID=1176587 RepID=A0A1A9HXA0_9BACT|nr:family 43 glycosylhydrolase [Niabella ginsenosidivorans]ANH80017.1 hypothetical protein A8C56_02610 [Niabella ginsenosidivorans]